MNIDKKTCINMGIVVFLLYLAIHYWDGLVGLFNLFLRLHYAADKQPGNHLLQQCSGGYRR